MLALQVIDFTHIPYRKSASRDAAGIGLAQIWCKITGSC
ncbi:hypothetical protein EFR84_02415 [Rhizobium chutanense]|uniref:Frog antimicrobial peptide brevinin-2/esculentin type domain-containing protein n=1 Tax=Rhizobium chutanense TaxID=2035448 RepID=A0A3S0SKI9_9HYPH|nr:hypothetical protein EFR84_02415 [Rhizobium chutanense]